MIKSSQSVRTSGSVRIADGFRGQILHAIPPPLLATATKQVLVGELYPTHLGWFPPAHHHYIDRPKGADQHILIYCIRGHGWFDVGGRKFILRPDQALLIPRNTPHAYGAEDDPWSIHWVHFDGEDSACYTSLLGHGEYVIPVSGEIRKRTESLFKECYDLFTAGFTSTRILLCAQTLRHLLALIFYGNPSFSPGTPAASHRSFGGTIEFMRRNLHGRLRLDDMARHAGFSVARFSTLFRAQTGFSPVDYYIRLRIQVACRMFDTTPMNVSEIAALVGYDDPFYFSRIFSKIMGVNPREYARQRPRIG